jgi:hypothetical protein
MREVSQVLHWTGMTLIGLFAVSFAVTAWPISLLEARWQQQTAELLLNGAHYPLIGATLMVVAGCLSPSTRQEAQRLRLVRRLALWACVGFVLLIPLLTVGGSSELKQNRSNAIANKARLAKAVNLVLRADSEPSLRQAVERFPLPNSGLPPVLPASVPEVRKDILIELGPKLELLNNQIDQELERRFKRLIGSLCRVVPMALIYGLGFAAIAQAEPSQPNLLSKLSQLSRMPGASSSNSWIRKFGKGRSSSRRRSSR